MTEIVNPGSYPSTAALQVVIELIRVGQLHAGVAGNEAGSIIATHQKLMEHFSSLRKQSAKLDTNSLA